MKKCRIVLLILCIVFNISGCADSYPLTNFTNFRVESNAPSMYVDVVADYSQGGDIGEWIKEDGTVQKIELRAMHGQFFIFEFQEDRSYAASDIPLFEGNYYTQGDEIVLQDESGIEIRLKKAGPVPTRHGDSSLVLTDDGETQGDSSPNSAQ